MGIGSDTEPVFIVLTGDGAPEWALNANRGACSKKLVGCSDVLLVCCDKFDEPLDVFRRS